MATTTEMDAIERAFARTGNRWILGGERREEVLGGVAEEVSGFVDFYKEHYGEIVNPFALIDINPDKAAAFFELYTNPPISIEMRVVVWRLIHGADIQSVRFNYDRDEGTELVITLIERGHREEYRSDRLEDFEAIRHIGTLTIDGKEILDGYYASTPTE